MVDREEAQNADIKRLTAALSDLLKRYVALANSGDCGFWNPEIEKVVIAARQELAKQKRADEHRAHRPK